MAQYNHHPAQEKVVPAQMPVADAIAMFKKKAMHAVIENNGRQLAVYSGNELIPEGRIEYRRFAIHEDHVESTAIFYSIGGKNS